MPWTHNAPQAGFSTAKPWLPVNPQHAAAAVDVQERDPHSLLQQTRQLIRLRRVHAALRTGASQVLWAEGDVLLLQRSDAAQGEVILALFNLGAHAAPWPVHDALAVPAPQSLWSTHPEAAAAGPAGDALPPGFAAFYMRKP